MEDIDVVVKKALVLFKSIVKDREQIAEANPTPEIEKEQIMHLLEFVQLNNKDFATTFPLVVRIMVLEGSFSAKAFRTFCKAIRTKPMRQHDEYLELQVLYMRLLYRETHPHTDERELRHMCAEALKQLIAEKEQFENKYKEAEKAIDATFKSIEEERRETLAAVVEEAARVNAEFPEHDSDDDDELTALELLAQLQSAERDLLGAVQTDAGDSDDDDMPPLEGPQEPEPVPDAPSHGRSAFTAHLRERLEEFADHEQRKADLGMTMKPIKIEQKK